MMNSYKIINVSTFVEKICGGLLMKYLAGRSLIWKAGIGRYFLIKNKRKLYSLNKALGSVFELCKKWW